jgi:hypothetical protein
MAEPRSKLDSSRTAPALPRVDSASDSGTRARRVAPTQPLPAASVPKLLVVGARPSETASVARSFGDAGALSRVCLALEQLPSLLASARWSFVMVDVRWEREVRAAVQGLGHHVPIVVYVPSSSLSHRGHVLPLGRADAEEILGPYR